MKKAFQKSRIPENRAFLVKELIAPFFDKTWHFHPEYQLFLVLKGCGTRFVGDDMQPFKENDLVFTGPNLPHLWRNDPEYFKKKSNLITHGIVIYFPESFIGEGWLEKEEFEEIRSFLVRGALGLEFKGETNVRIGAMMKDLLNMKGVESIIQLLKILKVLATSREGNPIAQAGYINTNKESEKDRMSQVYEYIMDHFQRPIKLEEVAAIANMTVSSFSRYFKTRMNKSFSDFLSDVRISHACKLLHDENLNISEICYESGFNTLSNFNRQFKDKMLVTPMKYKRDFLSRFEQIKE